MLYNTMQLSAVNYCLKQWSGARGSHTAQKPLGEAESESDL